MVAADAVTKCEIAPVSDQPEKVYFVPFDPWGVVVAIVCWVPIVQLTCTGAAFGVALSTLTNRPCGEVLIVTMTWFSTKFAVTETGLFIVSISGLLVLDVVPVQVENLYMLLADVAVKVTGVPAE